MDIYWHKELASTNDEAKKIAQSGALHGTLVGADFQTSGRGRSGKKWECAPGEGLMCSVVLRPKWESRYWGWIALATGLVIAELLERDCLCPEIKYPNDILVNGKKIAGVLSESTNDYVIVGLGMNLNMSELPTVDSGVKPTSFFIETDCKLEAPAYAKTMQRGVLDLLESDLPLLFRREIEKRLAWFGEEVELINRKEHIRGVISGIGDYGQLILDTVNGSQDIFDAHEIRLIGSETR